MESFGAEPFEIVERDDALSYWEFVHASDAVDSDSDDSDFGVASFDDGVVSVHSSVSESASLSLSDDLSLDLAGPVESADRDLVVSESLDRETLGVVRGLAPSFNVSLVRDEDPQSQSRWFGYEFGSDLHALFSDSLDREKLGVVRDLAPSFNVNLAHEEEPQSQSQLFGYEFGRNLRSLFSESLDRETLGVVRDLAPSFNVNLVHEDPKSQSQSFGYGFGSDLHALFSESLDHETLGVGRDHPQSKSQSIGYEFGWDYAYRRSNACEDEYDEEDFDDNDQDLDDELVPWSVNGKLGRQRMRKLGKRGFAKNSSKKAPHSNLKPGCVHGKHGLGVKHNF